MSIPNSDVWARLDALAKPRRSLGRLEELAVRLACIQQTLAPVVQPCSLVLFAADHGVVASGVSVWPQDITALMVCTKVAGRSASAALAAAHGCDLRVVEVVLLMDGYVATAAALVAHTLQPGLAGCMVASHLPSEPGHRSALTFLGLQPLLDWNMRLGERTGALAALGLPDGAAAPLGNVAALDELGVLRKD
ncbi:MAG: nicotinate-nucleotide--dimethylbenzimidazole phosphoribosyltransferase [Gammaproteobacteria bacterium]|jgi:NaMN:DMB phosphoribosyltransferase|nr:nicotinate-nucleotide--dimethylbenzimidazole phosphoribosyltransferase [Gammaproteobacteria bacterium]